MAVAQPATSLVARQPSPSRAIEVSPAMPMTKEGRPWRAALQARRVRRPTLSISSGAGSVPSRSTALVMVWQEFASSRLMARKMRGPNMMIALMPCSCCRSCRATPMARRRRPRPVRISDQGASPICRSASKLSTISLSSTSARASPVNFRRALLASSSRPCCTSQRGDLGNGTIPRKSTRAGTIWTPMAIRQPSSRGSSSWSRRAATTTPMMIITWNSDARLPRSSGGAISAWYKGTAVLRTPMEQPATTRPRMKT
mmetsp:Transcript_20692/g.54833  ORF Transcript_20692/g.54833 Transcript_20692/m.54833 type:complete len:257 (-) Transcript_20692:437-1207(-)